MLLTNLRITVSTIFVVSTLVLLSACSTSATDSAAPSPEPTQVIEADEPYANASLDELAGVADLVIRGEVIKIKHGIKLGEDKTVDYKAYTVTPTGSGKQSAVNVIVSEAYNGIPVAFEGRPELEVGDEAIWTLTKIDPQFNYKGYVLVGSTSLFPLDGDQIVGDGDAPGQVEAAKLGGKGTLQKLTGKTS